MLSPQRRAAWLAGTLPLALGVTVVVVALGGAAWRESLRYQRDALLAGQIWRVLSGNLVHLGWSHLLLNLAGLVLVWALFAPELAGRSGWVALLGSAAAVGLGLLCFDPQLQWYVGLSGVLHGLFAAGAWRRWRAGVAGAALALAVLAIKLAWEQFIGPMPGTGAVAGGPVVVDAHLYGALGGLCAALLSGARAAVAASPPQREPGAGGNQ